METGQTGLRLVYLWRHGEKNPSNAAVNPNQLTDAGKRESFECGVVIQDQRRNPLSVYCSSEDRSRDTGWYIRAGHAGRTFDDAVTLLYSDSAEKGLYMPEKEPLLEQRVPSHIRKAVKEKTLSAKDAVELCHRIVGQEPVDEQAQDERLILIDGAYRYLLGALKYLNKENTGDTVLVGHNPNIGCLGTIFEPCALISQFDPLTGIIFGLVDMGGIEGTLWTEVYAFETPTRQYKGTIGLGTTDIARAVTGIRK